MSVPVPTYEQFCERAKALFAAIPSEFTEGVEDVVLARGIRPAARHDILRGLYENSSPRASLS